MAGSPNLVTATQAENCRYYCILLMVNNHPFQNYISHIDGATITPPNQHTALYSTRVFLQDACAPILTMDFLR